MTYLVSGRVELEERLSVSRTDTECVLLLETKYLTMQLHYYDAVTPKDYEPFGFERATRGREVISYAKTPLTVKFGKAQTDSHGLVRRGGVEKV